MKLSPIVIQRPLRQVATDAIDPIKHSNLVDVRNAAQLVYRPQMHLAVAVFPPPLALRNSPLPVLYVAKIVLGMRMLWMPQEFPRAIFPAANTGPSGPLVTTRKLLGILSMEHTIAKGSHDEKSAVLVEKLAHSVTQFLATQHAAVIGDLAFGGNGAPVRAAFYLKCTLHEPSSQASEVLPISR